MPVFRRSVSLRMRHVRLDLDFSAGAVRNGTPSRKSRGRPATYELGGGKPSSREARRQRRAQQRRKGTNSEARELTDGSSARSQGPARQEVPVFFVTGAGKSGTTWLRRMLNVHPEVLCNGEGRFFGRDIKNARLKVLKAEARVVQPATLYNALAENEYLRMWLERTPWTREGDVEEHLTVLTREAVRLFLEKKLSESRKKVVGDKTPLLGPGIVAEISEIMPRAKVVHIVRDGRDRAISWMHQIWNRERSIEEGGQLTAEDQDKRDRYRENPDAFLASGESIFSETSIKTASRVWAENVGAAHRDGPRLLGENYTEVRYEDLLESPEQELERIFHFLGVETNKKVLRQSVRAESFEKRSGGRKRGEEDSTSARRKGVAGDWKNAFTERDKAIFKETAGELLVELGYAKDMSW
jgi:hypothetical protein